MSVLAELRPKASKQHRCWFCNEAIPQGEVHGYRAGVSDGDFWSMRFHLECQEKADQEKWTLDDYEFHEPGDFVRPKKPKTCARVEEALVAEESDSTGVAGNGTSSGLPQTGAQAPW